MLIQICYGQDTQTVDAFEYLNRLSYEDMYEELKGFSVAEIKTAAAQLGLPVRYEDGPKPKAVLVSAVYEEIRLAKQGLSIQGNNRHFSQNKSK